MRWLITGASGFTAQHFISHLKARGEDVFATSTTLDTAIKCDFQDEAAIKALLREIRPERVVHLTGVYGTDPKLAPIFKDVHVTQTENLIKACASMPNPTPIALASSAHVYGNQGGRISETAPLVRISEYAASKIEMEALAKKWSKAVPIFVARSFNYTGTGQSEKFLIPKIVQHFKNRAEKLILGDISIERDFSDIRDIIRYYLAMFEADYAGQVVNFCSGNLISVRDIVLTCQEITGHELQVEQSASLMRPNEIQVLYGCTDKLMGLTGCKPTITMMQTLSAMLDAPK
jgi:nucleoside-diphosphate-sugar epimerase